MNPAAVQESNLKALDQLHGMAKNEGAGFLFVLHGEREEAETGSFGEGYDIFSSWADRSGIKLLDFAAAEVESLKKGVDPYLLKSSIHINDAGQVLLADQLYEYFTAVSGGRYASEHALSSGRPDD